MTREEWLAQCSHNESIYAKNLDSNSLSFHLAERLEIWVAVVADGCHICRHAN